MHRRAPRLAAAGLAAFGCAFVLGLLALPPADARPGGRGGGGARGDVGGQFNGPRSFSAAAARSPGVGQRPSVGNQLPASPPSGWRPPDPNRQCATAGGGPATVTSDCRCPAAAAGGSRDHAARRIGRAAARLLSALPARLLAALSGLLAPGLSGIWRRVLRRPGASVGDTSCRHGRQHPN